MSTSSINLHPDYPTVLLVDDEPQILLALTRVLAKLSANVVKFSQPHDALNFCQEHYPDIVISDQRMPQMTGCELLKKIKSLHPSSTRMILSAHQDFDTISNAFNEEIVDRFIPKPWHNSELRFIVDKALDKSPITNTIDEYSDSLLINTPINFHGIISLDDRMKTLFISIKRASTSNAPIFITGETGTGKELVARACHKESYHNDCPFIAINCANFNETLMESQLFGHVKGSFTGAITAQQGLFGAADQGTLFLDEITTLSPSLQAKLLRVIQERCYSPVGSTKEHQFSAQIISASSTSLRDAVIAGKFREDLFYRLNVINLSLPPLRERQGDTVILAKYFLNKFALSEHRKTPCFSKAAMDLICQYDWPGNIRQLENTIRSLIILNPQTTIDEAMVKTALSSMIPSSAIGMCTLSLPSDVEPSQCPRTADILPLAEIEKKAIKQAIDYCNGNIPKAAALLGVSPSTLYRKRQRN